VTRPVRLKKIHAYCVGPTVRMSWSSTGETPPVVRILRSAAGYPLSPGDAMRPESRASRVYQGRAADFTDHDLAPGVECFYSLFARGEDGEWQEPVKVHSCGAARGNRVEVVGDRGLGRGGRAAVSAAGVIFEATFLPAVLLTMILYATDPGGTAQRVAVALSVTSVVAWRLCEGHEASTRTMLRWLAVPAFIGVVTCGLLAMMPAELFTGRTDVGYVGVLGLVWCGGVVPASMAGWWTYASAGIAPAAAPGARLRVAVTAALPLVMALIVPDLVIVAGAVIAVVALVARFRPRRLRVGREEPPPGPPAAAAPASAPRLGAAAVAAYRCPRHGLAFDLPGTRRFARQYAVATADDECLCPGRAPWHVRLGVSRRDLLLWTLVCLWALNFADFMLTWRTVVVGGALETNLLMDRLFDYGLLPAFLFKMGIVTAGALVIWRYRRHRVMLHVAALVTVAYLAVVVYQVVALVA
jgi:hypothetical protein